MNWTTIYGFLVVTFIAHLLAFALRYGRTKDRVNLLLCGTFTCLALLFFLKYRGLDWPVGLLTVQVVLRMLSGGFTLLALYLGLKKLKKNAELAGRIPSPWERREKQRGRRELRRDSKKRRPR